MAVFKSGESCSCPKTVALFRTEGQPSVRKSYTNFGQKGLSRAEPRPVALHIEPAVPADRTLFSWPWEAGRALHRAKVLELSEDHWFGNQVALEALVRFSDEELKHQALFRLFRHQMHCDSLRRCLVEVRAHRYG